MNVCQPRETSKESGARSCVLQTVAALTLGALIFVCRCSMHLPRDSLSYRHSADTILQVRRSHGRRSLALCEPAGATRQPRHAPLVPNRQGSSKTADRDYQI